MEIDVELFGQLAGKGQKRYTLTLDQPLTAGEVASLLQLDLAIIGLVTIDGIQVDLKDRVTSDCRLCFFPYLSGGSAWEKR